MSVVVFFFVFFCTGAASFLKHYYNLLFKESTYQFFENDKVICSNCQLKQDLKQLQ